MDKIYKIKITRADGKKTKTRTADKNKLIDICDKEFQSYLTFRENEHLEKQEILIKRNLLGDQMLIINHK